MGRLRASGGAQVIGVSSPLFRPFEERAGLCPTIDAKLDTSPTAAID
jgi:hypothetical protein